METPKKIQEEIDKYARRTKNPEKFREAATSAYKKARAESGEAIGVITAQSIGEPGTQLAMRTKLLVGVTEVNITLGLPRLIEIFDARKEASTPSMIIYLKGNFAKDRNKVRSLAQRIQEIKLEHLIDYVTVDLLNFQIKAELSEEKMKHFGIKKAEILKSLKNELKEMNLRVGARDIVVKPKSKEEDKDIRSLYQLKVRIREAHIRGVPGIHQVLPVLDQREKRWIIKTAGSNLREVLRMPEVDETKTTTNNIFEIAHVLGIEAARNAIIIEVMAPLKDQGVPLDVRHVMLVADVMTFNGKVQGIGRYGISGEKSSILARASFEVPLKHLFNAAVRRGRDDLKGIVENIMINQPAPIGTGILGLVVKKKEEKSENAR